MLSLTCILILQSGLAQNSAESQLNHDIQALNDARQGGNPIAVESASKTLIAYSLRILARAQTMQTHYSQALTLANSSLQYADSVDTKLDIALIYMDEKNIANAIKIAESVYQDNPNSQRAVSVLADAYILNAQYSKAEQVYKGYLKDFPDNIQIQFLLAKAYLASNDPQSKIKAKQILENIVRIAGDSSQLHVMFGRAYRDVGAMQSAANEFIRAIYINPRTQYAHYYLGLAYLSMNEWQPTPQVESELQQEIKYFPKEFLANYILGSIESREGKYSESNVHLQDAINIDPTWPELWIYLGLNSMDQGKIANAREYLRKAIQLTGTNISRSDYIVRKAYIALGKISEKSGDSEMAKSYFATARNMQNDIIAKSRIDLSKSISANNSGKSVAGVVDYAGRINVGGDEDLQSQGNNEIKDEAKQAEYISALLGQAYFSLGVSYAQQGNCEAAIGEFSKSIDASGDNLLIERNYGQCAYSLKKYNDAIRELSQYLQESPSKSLTAMLGISLYSTNKYKQAIQEFSKLGQAGMSDPIIGYAWSDSLIEIGNYEDAEKVLQVYIKGDISNEERIDSGRLLIRIKDYKNAILDLKTILMQDPKYLGAHLDIGEAYMGWQMWDAAEREFEEEINVNPNDVNAQYDLGYVYLQTSNTSRAQVIFENILKSDPQYAKAQYQLGKILLSSGNTADALKHLQIASKLMPNADYVHYQLQVAYRKSNDTINANNELKIYNILKSSERKNIAAGMGSN